MNIDLKLCKIMTKNVFDEKIIFKVDSIEQCYETPEGYISLLTGDFAGEFVPKYDSNLVKDGDCCAETENIENLKKFFPHNDLDSLRDEMSSVLCDSSFVMDKNGALVPTSIDFIDDCVQEYFKDDIKEPKKKPLKRELSLKEIESKIKKDVIGQDDAVRKVLTTIYTNKKIFDSNLSNEQQNKLKNNLLIFGKTGTGKTEIVRQVAKYIDVPMTVEDATKYTIEGYVGKSVDQMLLNLYKRANGNLGKAQRGILVIDEIDKKKSGSNTGFVGAEGVQNSLLKIIEGEKFELDLDEYSTITFDTSKLTVVFSGAFSNIYGEHTENKKLGFGNSLIDSSSNLAPSQVEADDFVKFGMIPEIMGRISAIIPLNDFTLEDYKNIIKKSKISPIYLKRLYYKSQGVGFRVEEEFITKIALEAMKLNEGARGIKKALDKYFVGLDYEIMTEGLERINFNKNGVSRVRKENSKK